MILILVFVVALVVQAIFLGVGLGFVNGSNRELGSTFVTALLMSIVTLIPCLGCFIAWYFIKSRHNVGWGGALVAWLLGAIIMVVVLLVLALTVFAAVFGGIWALFGL